MVRRGRRRGGRKRGGVKGNSDIGMGILRGRGDVMDGGATTHAGFKI